MLEVEVNFYDDLTSITMDETDRKRLVAMLKNYISYLTISTANDHKELAIWLHEKLMKTGRSGKGIKPRGLQT